MAPDGDELLQSINGNRIIETATISRRHALQTGIVTAVSLAGCLDNESSSDSVDGGDNETNKNGGDDEPGEQTTDDDVGNDTDGDTENNTDDDAENDTNADEEGGLESDEDPLSVVYAFLEAALDEDIDRMSELSHSRNPLDPAGWVEEGWEFRGGGGEEEALEELDAEVIDNDATVADLFDLEGAEFWFEEEELSETLDGADMALVEVSAEDPTEDDTIWLLATEDGEWRYLFAASVDDRPDNPEEVFEEPVEDEDDDVVVEIDWEHESQTSDVQQAAVVLTDERGVDANRIEIEATIEGASNGAFDRDDDEFTATWEDATLFVPYDTDGDQIVVTAINEAENTSDVVHREHYEP